MLEVRRNDGRVWNTSIGRLDSFLDPSRRESSSHEGKGKGISRWCIVSCPLSAIRRMRVTHNLSLSV